MMDEHLPAGNHSRSYHGAGMDAHMLGAAGDDDELQKVILESMKEAGSHGINTEEELIQRAIEMSRKGK